MNESNDRVELKRLIEKRTWMINDARLFTWAKCDGRLKIIEGLKIGGGNFLVTLGLFAVLNFLSKAYYLLQEGSEVWSEEEIKKTKKILRKLPKGTKAFPPVFGSPKKTERDCFIDFALALQFPLFSNSKELSKKEQTERYSEIWESYRNKLSHMAMPKHAAVTLNFADLKYEGSGGAEELLEIDTSPAFIKSGTLYAVRIDFFARDIKKWVNWINQEIDENPKISDERVKATLNWTKNN